MQKSYLILAAAAIGMASCSSNEFFTTGEKADNTADSAVIAFSATNPNMSRGTYGGASAADKLNDQFVVYGVKHSNDEDGTDANDFLVYDMYQVTYDSNGAGTTSTNETGWDYVGKTSYSANVTGKQSIHYWDLDATNGYTFYAFSSPDINYPAKTDDDVVVKKITTETTSKYLKGYTVTVKKDAKLDELYFSDRKEVKRSDFENGEENVLLTFRNMSSKVRVGFYETIPGYSVTIDRFYYDDDANAPVTKYKEMDKTSETNFVAALDNINGGSEANTFTVTYYDDTDRSVENRPTVNTTTGATHQYTLTLGTGIQGNTLGTSASTATWDNGGAYTSAFPNEQNTQPMLVRCDYTLTATDGSADVIHVKNARAIVPVEYCAWKSNTVYTYLFKISDKTNGTTGTTPTDPDNPSSGDVEGLYPITFDAVVIANDDASYDQETVTTVSNNSITSYQKGRVVTSYNEYTDGDIYVVNSNIDTKAVIAPTAIGTAATQAKVYKVTTNGDNISEATVLAKLTGAANGIVLSEVDASLVKTVPAADGTNYDFGDKGAVKFTGAASNYYAYVYCNTAYVATEYEAAPSAFSSTKEYYFKTNTGIYYPASGITEETYNANKSNLFVVKTEGTAGSYDIKVIKVGTLGETAATYKYSDYTYVAKSITTVGNTITFKYAKNNYTGNNIMNDLARFLGALYRQANVQTIKGVFTTGVTSTFQWNTAGTLKGSNYVNVADGTTTLVSTITKWYNNNPTATQLQLTLDGVDTTFKFEKE